MSRLIDAVTILWLMLAFYVLSAGVREQFQKRPRDGWISLAGTVGFLLAIVRVASWF